jgi:hypothetical protein
MTHGNATHAGSCQRGALLEKERARTFFCFDTVDGSSRFPPRVCAIQVNSRTHVPVE